MANEKTGTKSLNPQTKVVDGTLCMMLARSGNRAVKTELYWDIRQKNADEPFIMVMKFPGLDSPETNVSMPLDSKGGQCAYANHPRKVHPSQVPSDCPVHEILEALDGEGNIPLEAGKKRPGRKPKVA